MKTAKFTFLALCAATVAISCSKSHSVENKLEPWVNDESLQVPVQIISRTSNMTTKAGEISSLENVEFGVYALGDDQKPQPVLFQDLYAEGSNCIPSHINAENMADLTIDGIPVYYPLSSTNNYTFYGFHVSDVEGSHTKVEDDGTVAINNYGLIDVLWSQPAVATPIDDPEKGTIEGFCAKYIRSVYKLNLVEQNLPKLHFEHLTSEFIFRVKAADERAETSFLPENGNVRITDAVIKNLPASARLNVMTGEILEETQLTDKICDIPAEGIYPVYTLDGTKISEFFISPGTAATLDNIEFSFTIKQNPVGNEDPTYKVTGADIRSKFEAEPLFEGFKPGYRYYLTITMSSAEKIEIKVSLEPWKDGFTGDIIDIE